MYFPCICAYDCSLVCRFYQRCRNTIINLIHFVVVEWMNELCNKLTFKALCVFKKMNKLELAPETLHLVGFLPKLIVNVSHCWVVFVWRQGSLPIYCIDHTWQRTHIRLLVAVAAPVVARHHINHLRLAAQRQRHRDRRWCAAAVGAGSSTITPVAFCQEHQDTQPQPERRSRYDHRDAHTLARNFSSMALEATLGKGVQVLCRVGVHTLCRCLTNGANWFD